MTKDEARKLAKKIFRSLAKTEASFQIRKLIRTKAQMLIDAHRDALLVAGGLATGAGTTTVPNIDYDSLAKLSWEEIPPVFRDIYPRALIAGGVPEEFAEDLAKATAEEICHEDLADTMNAIHPDIDLPPFDDSVFDTFPEIIIDPPESIDPPPIEPDGGWSIWDFLNSLLVDEAVS